MSTHVATYMDSFHKFRERICVPKAESLFEEYLKAYRGQGYWIPEFEDDVDVKSITSLIPEYEKKLVWIRSQAKQVGKSGLPSQNITKEIRFILGQLLQLKKSELSVNESEKVSSRKESLKLQEKL